MSRPPKRSAVIVDLQRIGKLSLDVIVSEARACDELIVVVNEAEDGFTVENSLTGGERMARIRSLLRSELDSPFYVLPLKTMFLSKAQQAIRLQYELPRFQRLVTDDAALARAAIGILKCETRVIAQVEESENVLTSTAQCRRGLFIARAQPFHLGHLACIQKIATEVDEVIVLLALSESSYSLHNPTTAGERIEMIQPVLEFNIPGRYHLAAAPMESHTASNIGELQILLPEFEVIYSNNSTTRAMALSMGLPCCPILSTVQVSGSMVRETLIRGNDVTSLVPPEIASSLEELGIRERLQILSTSEVRTKH